MLIKKFIRKITHAKQGCKDYRQFGEADTPKKKIEKLYTGAWDRDCFSFWAKPWQTKKELVVMGYLEKEVLRMEMQIGELIRIVANLNERLKELEDINEYKSYTQKIQFGQKTI